MFYYYFPSSQKDYQTPVPNVEYGHSFLTQTSACSLKLFYTQSIKNEKSFLKQKFHILYNQTAII